MFYFIEHMGYYRDYSVMEELLNVMFIIKQTKCVKVPVEAE
jgi:hypothetical protein